MVSFFGSDSVGITENETENVLINALASTRDRRLADVHEGGRRWLRNQGQAAAGVASKLHRVGETLC